MVWKSYDAEILSIVLNQIFSFDVKSFLYFW